MPSSEVGKLTPVAAEYLRNYDDLEAAREVYLSERAKMLDGFGAVMVDAAATAKQTVVSTKRDDQYGLYDVYINGTYTVLRAKGGEKRTSGYSTALGSLHGHVGAQTLLWFQFKPNPAREARLELAALCKQLGEHTHLVGEAGWIYLVTARQVATAVDLDALREEAARLPALFSTADAWIAQRWPK